MKSISFTLGDYLLYSCEGGVRSGSLLVHFNCSASFRIVFLVGLLTSNNGIFNDCGCIRILIMLSAACIQNLLVSLLEKELSVI